MSVRASGVALGWGVGEEHRSQRERQASRPLTAALLEGLALPVLKEPGSLLDKEALCHGSLRVRDFKGQLTYDIIQHRTHEEWPPLSSLDQDMQGNRSFVEPCSHQPQPSN